MKKLLLLLLLSSCASGPSVRAPAAVAGLFSQREILELRFEAPWQKLLEDSAIAEIRGMEAPVANLKITYREPSGSEQVAMAKVNVRGNTSRSECEFPKLKVELDKSERRGLFENVSSFKLNSHCGEDEAHTHLGRFASEKATLREALAYEWGAALDLPVSLVRRAHIRYVDTAHAREIYKFALLIEGPGATAKRLGGKRFKEERYSSDARRTMGLGMLAKVYFFENLVGNWDWHLDLDKRMGDNDERFETSRLWNMDVIELERGRELPMPYDFDMASLVSGRPRLTGNKASSGYLRGAPDLKRYLGFEIIHRTRASIPRRELLAAAREFRQKEVALRRLIAEPFLDPDGVEIAEAHLDAFMALAGEDGLSTPMILRATNGSKAPGGGDVACALQPASPFRLLERSGEKVRIEYQGLGCSEPSLWVPAADVEIPGDR